MRCEQTKLTEMLEVKQKDRSSGNLGNLLKRKMQGSWKQSWVELLFHGFFMHKEEGDRKGTYMVALKGALCELQRHADMHNGMRNVFEVVAHTYEKNSVVTPTRGVPSTYMQTTRTWRSTEST